MYFGVLLFEGISDTIYTFSVSCFYMTHSTSYGHFDWFGIHGMQRNAMQCNAMQSNVI
jgi:hypothetical protein